MIKKKQTTKCKTETQVNFFSMVTNSSLMLKEKINAYAIIKSLIHTRRQNNNKKSFEKWLIATTT